MRLQVLSDLHLEYGGGVPPLASGVDVVVMAGDIAPAVQRAARFPAESWSGAAHILYVPGNHEFHGADIEDGRRLLARDCAECGVTLLDTAAVTIGDVRFIGATLWTDFCLPSGADGPPDAGAVRLAGDCLRDFSGHIRDASTPGRTLLTPAETMRRHARDRAFIEAEIARAHAAGLEAVVITHHAPSPASIHHSQAGNPLNAAFVSDLDAMIVHLRPALWIHGHVHNTVNMRLGRTWILANPRGIGFMEEADFSPDLIVDL